MKAVIFDMDGVIVDTEPYNMRRVYEYVHSLRPEAKIEDMYQNAGRVKEDVWTRIASIIGNGKGGKKPGKIMRETGSPVIHLSFHIKKFFEKIRLQFLNGQENAG